MAIFWTPDDLPPAGRVRRPPWAFAADEFAGWIDGEAVTRAATAIRAHVRRFAALLHGAAWRRPTIGALPTAIKHRRLP